MTSRERKGGSVVEQEKVAPSTADVPAPRRPADGDPDLDSRSEALALTGIVTLAVGWFGVSWLVLKSPVVDAVGEAAGGVVTVLFVVSVFGAFRRSRGR
jgi:hypothetical protein